MNLRRVSITMLVALIISASCTWLLSRKMGSQAPVVKDLEYVSSSKPLTAGEILKPEELEMVKWPAANPLSGTFTKPEEIVGRALLYPIEKGQPLTERILSTPGAGVGIAGKIPSGMRAIALRTDEVMGVGGFLFPGSHLDVLVTYHTPTGPEPITSTVLQDAEVIAAGHQIQPDPEGKPATVTVVTLLLNPADAERAVLASTQGVIHFVLRSGSDKVKTDEAPIALSQLAGPTPQITQGHLTRVAGPRSVRSIAAVPVLVVETVAGDKSTSESFRGASR